jgi:antitoxin component of MazEF toxin-antitoxin module
MVIPRSLREEVGVSEGAMLKVAVTRGGQLLITQQFIVDRPLSAEKRGASNCSVT